MLKATLAATESDVWVTEPALRRRLTYSAATLSRLCEKGLPHLGTGRLRRYHIAEVLQWPLERA
jgi:hypothetical protein